MHQTMQTNKLYSWGGFQNLVLGGDFNCVISASDKRGGKPVDIRKAWTIELNALIKTQNLLDTWRYKNPHSFGPTWANPSNYNVDWTTCLFQTNRVFEFTRAK